MSKLCLHKVSHVYTFADPPPLLLRTQVNKSLGYQHFIFFPDLGIITMAQSFWPKKMYCKPMFTQSIGQMQDAGRYRTNFPSLFDLEQWPTCMKRALLLQGQILSLQGFRSVQVSSCLITINPYQPNCFFRPLRDTGWSSQWWWIGLGCYQPGNAPALIRWVCSCVFGMI